MTRALALLLVLAAAFCIPAGAMADELRPGAAQLVETLSGRWSVSWKQPLAGPGLTPPAIPLLPSQCRYQHEPVIRTAPLALVGQATAVCTGGLDGRRIGWPGVQGRGDALLRVAPLGRPVQSFRLTAERPFAVVEAVPDRWQVARTYLSLGFEHILEGWDHLLFVIALVLLVARAGPVIMAATAFTLAHSLTLAAVTLGMAGLPQQPVEALIALSIIMLAVEAVRGEGASLTRRLPWLVAFAFGLVHGFGFADALQEIGLPEGEVIPALLAFNLGVEAGQIAVIAAVWATRALLRRYTPSLESPAIRVASYGIGITGGFWLIDRMLA